MDVCVNNCMKLTLVYGLRFKKKKSCVKRVCYFDVILPMKNNGCMCEQLYEIILFIQAKI